MQKLPEPQWRDVTGRKEHGWSSSVKVYRYGESLTEPQARDIYLVAGVESSDPPWSLFDHATLFDEDVQRLNYSEDLPVAMEFAQRYYWGKIYEQVVGYNAAEDDPFRTSLDMITTVSCVLGHMEAQEEARSYFAT